MDLTLVSFNRIIDLTLYTAAGIRREIKCPRHGRKPSIEINGTYTSRGYLASFNIAVKNLYLDLQTEQYTRIKVEAGYATDRKTNTATFEGTILTIYQEAPGPEGRTIIQCQQGKLQEWLDATVQLNYEAGAVLGEILESIKNKLKIAKVQTGIKAKMLIIKEPFMHDGSARGAIEKLEKLFEEEKLVIFMLENTLYAECLSKDHTGAKVLQYMSAPPQPNVGGANGTFYTTVTAPWMPKLHMFDKLIIPSRVYIKNFGLVGTGKTQNIQVTGLSFHFGTTGGTNQMTVQGPLVG